MAEKPVNKGGRPKAIVDKNVVEALAEIGCTQREIAAFVGCSAEVINRRFQTEIALGTERLKTSLRRMQWKSAKNGNVPMQIWLGKQYLGQCEPTRMDIIGDDTPRVAGYTAKEFDRETVMLIMEKVQQRIDRRSGGE